MLIRLDNPSDLETVKNALEKQFATSRFICEIYQKNYKNLKLVKIRLRKNKPYCGNHPAFCENNFSKPRSLSFLEGLDWVAVNDLINDVLDRLGVSANVASSVCVVRRYTKRRIAYHEDGRNRRQWDKKGEDCFVDYCGKIAPRSNYPIGTPGNPSYL